MKITKEIIDFVITSVQDWVEKKEKPGKEYKYNDVKVTIFSDTLTCYKKDGTFSQTGIILPTYEYDIDTIKDELYQWALRDLLNEDN